MSSTTYRFIQPLDVLFLRGNKLFGDPGSHGESLVPPWPSVAAGALRSLMLSDSGMDLAAFAAGRQSHPELGTPQAPGSFALTDFTLARRDARGQLETLHPLPADLVVSQDASAGLRVQRLQPHEPAPGLLSSAPLAQWPLLAQADRSKASSGLWLSTAGWAAYLAGRLPTLQQLVGSEQLWRIDNRVGVGLDPSTRRAADGQLFSAQAVAFRPEVGFLAAVRGATLPEHGMLRLGGDGRGAALQTIAYQPPKADLADLCGARRCRIVLTSPGLFAGGWLPPGVDGERRIRLPGFSARLACAAVPRAEIVSGWDLAQRQPKSAQRVAPTGSVYWLDELDATPQALGNLAEQGLWAAADENPQRRAEGFNRFSFAAW
ncbi:type III-B CRISPR module-associated protein Cmr3 [uncultured Azohydromonas sp.]|jgi:CRISPR-associated protein (Cas_Cmr3).|uniref:type III-B CRISPR module-associated protein Cmr3 n=1 Tax=uncultured Azohydromonas sp. TaxID=487342 RepID=UPI0026267B9D|nr:type III-B CRISPR module-associated protein Cmr3 [uncultured Azohydromonas sp.]